MRSCDVNWVYVWWIVQDIQRKFPLVLDMYGGHGVVERAIGRVYRSLVDSGVADKADVEDVLGSMRCIVRMDAHEDLLCRPDAADANVNVARYEASGPEVHQLAAADTVEPAPGMGDDASSAESQTAGAEQAVGADNGEQSAEAPLEDDTVAERAQRLMAHLMPEVCGSDGAQRARPFAHVMSDDIVSFHDGWRRFTSQEANESGMRQSVDALLTAPPLQCRSLGVAAHVDEWLPAPIGTFDAVVSCLALHWYVHVGPRASCTEKGSKKLRIFLLGTADID